MALPENDPGQSRERRVKSSFTSSKEVESGSPDDPGLPDGSSWSSGPYNCCSVPSPGGSTRRSPHRPARVNGKR